jgi:hypothetical protein
VNELGKPDHDPSEQLNFLPMAGVPLIFGAVSLTGDAS